MASKEKDNFLSKNIVYFIGIGFLLIGICVANGIQKYRENLFNLNYEVNIRKITEALSIMDTSVGDYFYSSMYTTSDNPDYDETSGVFIKNYLSVKKYCGSSNGDCFAKKYKDLKNKVYIPEYKGACALLINGASICITPQIKDNDITGLIDLNASDAPNIYGKDLRDITIKARKSLYKNNNSESGDVIEIQNP